MGEVVDLAAWKERGVETLRVRLDSLRIEFAADGGLELHLEGSEGEDIEWELAPECAEEVALTVLGLRQAERLRRGS